MDEKKVISQLSRGELWKEVQSALLAFTSARARYRGLAEIYNEIWDTTEAQTDAWDALSATLPARTGHPKAALDELQSGDPVQLGRYLRRVFRDKQFDDEIRRCMAHGLVVPHRTVARAVIAYEKKLLEYRGAVGATAGAPDFP